MTRFTRFAIAMVLGAVTMSQASVDLPRPITLLPMRTVQMHTGPLRQQLAQIAKQWGWQDIVWQSQHDYQWQGETALRTQSLPKLFGLILVHYPLQATFYQGNHVLVITPREISQ